MKTRVVDDRYRVAWSYVLDLRKKAYEAILVNAISKDYECLSIRDFITREDGPRKALILRHDVDYVSPGTRCLFDIERQYDVRASYYFRRSCFDFKLMKQIEEYGSEASLHFEQISNYISRRRIESRDELTRLPFIEECLVELKAEISVLREEYGLAVDTIAAHGAPENRRLRISNNMLTESHESYRRLGIKAEVYDTRFISKINCYISDSPIEVNGGYRYGISPIECIERSERAILLLTHPHLWSLSYSMRLARALRVLRRGTRQMNTNFHRIHKLC